MELVTSLGRADTTLGELTAIVRKDPVIVAQILAPPLNAASHGRTGAQGERPREDRSTTRSAAARPVAAGLHPARGIGVTQRGRVSSTLFGPLSLRARPTPRESFRNNPG
jgi:hypothetical protein